MCKNIVVQFFYYAIIVLFTVVTVMAGYCILKMFYPRICLGSYAEVLTALVATIALVISLAEYYFNKDSKQAQVLSEYNKRYSSDPYIVKVVKYLNYIDKDGTINNPPRERPTNYDVEMFMRFFEELKLQIESKRLSEEDVFNLFCYYAYIITKNRELRIFLGITDEDYNNYWSGYKSLMEKYKDYKKLI